MESLKTRVVDYTVMYFSGLTTPTGACDSGYYCNAGSDRANPTDGIMGDFCPEGRYCRKF